MLIIWVDDDDPNRFIYEQKLIEARQATLVWAHTPEEAAERLAQDAYDAVILDQFMPFNAGARDRSPWAGYILLCWLRCLDAPNNIEQEVREAVQHLRDTYTPARLEGETPVLILSAFHDRDVEEAMQLMQSQGGRIPFIPKPADHRQLMSWLQSIEQSL